MPLPNLLNILGPLLFPTGSASSTIRPATPMQFDGEQPAALLPDLTQLENYVGSQERNTARNVALENAEEISSSINTIAEVTNIMERNKKALGLNGGPNGFYDINLVHPASPDRPGSADKEPDGFRLYLIAPPRPAVAVVAAALGNAVNTGAAALKSGIDSTVDITLHYLLHLMKPGTKQLLLEQQLKNIWTMQEQDLISLSTNMLLMLIQEQKEIRSIPLFFQCQEN